MSNIGKPQRKLWFDFKYKNNENFKEEDHLPIKFLYGHLLEEVLLFLVRITKHSVTDEQKEVEVKVVKGNKSLTYLTRGNFIGEISFVSKENAIADVVANGPVTYIMWTKKQIETLKRDNNIFWIKLQNILMKDMIGKIKRSNQS